MHEQRPLELIDLTKTYDGHRVVDHVTLHANRGEIFGILGTNGAGKTTSVECAQGIRRPDSGTVRVLGYDPIADRAALAGRVGSQLQDSGLPDRLRVGEALRLFADSTEQVDRSIEEWDLDPMLKTPYAALSGGQKQRLFLALALLNNPEIVFLDELTQGLDPNARRDVWALIERVRDRGTTVVLVTHFMEEAEALCDRVAVLRAGQVIDTGTPAALIERHGSGTRVRFDRPAGNADWVRSVPGVQSCTINETTIEASGATFMVAELGAAAIARGLSPIELRVDQPSLESALLRLLATADATNQAWTSPSTNQMEYSS
jgi:ABC-2 type transport system ATP-binding protein